MVPGLVTVFVMAVLVQVLIWRGMGRRLPIGDEVEYLHRGRSRDPHAPERFLRPPTLPWLAKLSHLQPASGENRLRLVFATVSCLTIALTAYAGWLLAGPGVALIAAVLFATQPERLLLANHLWPETLLAATLAALAVTQSLPTSTTTALIAGLLVALGVSIRIDFLAALPFLLVAWPEALSLEALSLEALSLEALSLATIAALSGPSIVLLAALTIRNFRRYGIALPDTTWSFNLLAAHYETLAEADRQPGIEQPIADALATWEQLPQAQTSRTGWVALSQLLRSPVRFARGSIRRLLTLIGPDTFIRQKLLPRDAAYPELGDAARHRWERLLKLSLPALIATTLTLSVAGGQPPPSYTWPTLGLVLVSVLFHARTRNRVAFLPILALVASQQIATVGWALARRPESATLVTVSLLIAVDLLIFFALIRIRCSQEF